jgi:putative ABC transport system permease protein
LTESLLLAGVAGALSWWVTQSLPQALFSLSADMPLEVPLEPDWRVFLFTFAAAAIAGCVAGLSPALESLRVNLTSSLRPTGSGAGGSQVRVRRWLVTGQLAASIGLLVAAGLIVRVQTHLFQTDLGYDPRTVVVTPLALSHVGYTEAVARAFHDRLLERVRNLPGIHSAALARGAPFRQHWSTVVSIPGDDRTQSRHRVSLRGVSPAYFETMRIPILQGRHFTDAEVRSPGRPVPIIVSTSLARRFWPDKDPLGQRLRGPDDSESLVIGVAGDISSVRPGELDGPIYYEPLARHSVLDSVLIARTAGDGAPLLPALRTAIRELNSDLPVEPETLRAELDRQAERYAFLIKVAWVPSVLALTLCVLGVYGVAAFAAAQRTQEIGVRLAIGARPQDVIRLLVGGIRWPLMVGVLGGVGFGATIGGLMSANGLLTDVHPIDPVTYAAACATVGGAAILATFIPARRASRLDPWLAIRDQ